MIVYEGPGNIFHSSCQTLVVPINCVGTMGAGLARAFSDSFPGLLQEYLQHFPVWHKRQVHPAYGRRLRVVPLPQGRRALLFPTKLHWKDPSPIGLIRDNLRLFMRDYAHLGVTSVAFPPLGCGHGGLNYRSDVRPMMLQALSPIPVAVEIYVR